MSAPRVTAVVLALLLLLGGAGYLWWPAGSEEARVRAVIDEVVAGAEAADLGRVTAPLSDDFTAENNGNAADTSMVRALLARQFLRRGPIFVLLGEVAVEVRGDEAHASFDAFLAENSTSITDVLPVDADAWHLEVDLRKHGDDWLVTRAVRSDAEVLPGGDEAP